MEIDEFARNVVFGLFSGVWTKRLLAPCLVCLLSAPPTDETTGPADAEGPQLRGELLSRAAIDQQARNAIVEWTMARGPFDAERATADEKLEFDTMTAFMVLVDVNNTCWLKGVVERHGWPTSSLVGKDGARAAWLLVQHADLDSAFQRRALDLIAKLPAGEVSPAHVAYLTDRVLLAEGKKQRYGTQFQVVDGRPQPRPLEDPENVDRRRAAVGLAPLAEYAKTIEEAYGIGAE